MNSVAHAFRRLRGRLRERLPERVPRRLCPQFFSLAAERRPISRGSHRNRGARLERCARGRRRGGNRLLCALETVGW